MSENKAGDYEPKIKFRCLNCDSPNISFYEPNIRTEWKTSVKIIVSIENEKPSLEGLYICEDCKAGSLYPLFRYKDTNQTSTTKINTVKVDITKNT